MNKKQLAVLWCVVLIVLATLADGWGITALGSNTAAQMTLGVVIFGSLVVYTLKHIQDNKFLIRLLGGAIGFGFAIAAFNYYQNVLSIVTLPAAEISKVKIENTPKSYDNGDIFAEVYNGSNYEISSLNIRISAEARPSQGATPVISGFTPLNSKDKSAQQWEPPEVKNHVDLDGWKVLSETKPKILWQRDYKDSMYLAPLSTSIFHVKATDTTNVTLSYKIVEAHGRKQN
jgi:hypothetical protein